MLSRRQFIGRTIAIAAAPLVPLEVAKRTRAVTLAEIVAMYNTLAPLNKPAVFWTASQCAIIEERFFPVREIVAKTHVTRGRISC